MSGTEPCPGSPVHKRSTVTRASHEGSWMNLKQFHHNSTLASKRRGLRSSANHFFLKLGRFCPFSKATSGLYLPAGLSPGVFRLWCPLHLRIEEGQIASPFCFWNMDIVWYLFWLPPLVAFLLSPPAWKTVDCLLLSLPVCHPLRFEAGYIAGNFVGCLYHLQNW